MKSDLIAQAEAAIKDEDYDRANQILCVPGEEGDADVQFLLGYLFFTAADITKEGCIWSACCRVLAIPGRQVQCLSHLTPCKSG